MSNKQVTVVGSYNVGLFLVGDELPNPGETVIGNKFHEGGGGKGSNQALTSAMMGAETIFIGRIGNDKYGEDALKRYRDFGVSTSGIIVDETIHSGISVILVDKKGRNLISVVPGANFKLTKEDIDANEKTFASSAIVGFQLETNLEIVEYAIKKVYSLGIPTLLDPAPGRKLPDELFPYITFIKPNEHEASIITGKKVTDSASAIEAGKWFLDRGVDTAIITLGEAGSVVVSGQEEKWYPAPEVDTIDTTGAGDCFSGAFMAYYALGNLVDDALLFACSSAALSVTKLGVTEAIPTKEEVASFYQDFRERISST
jgi:ribokinase